MTCVKICGINSEAAFDACIEHGADLIGFVFFPRSPRFVTLAQAATLTNRHQGGPLRVGLFVTPTEADIQAALDHLHLDYLQLYAPLETCQAIKTRFSIKTARAIPITTPQDLPTTQDNLDALLIESAPPPKATRPGGNAHPIDWSLTKSWAAPLPWLLAGGLTPENVAQAVTASNAPGVDISSGVETTPGVKSPTLIAAFIANARRAGVGK
jgi:phosphoribosylanthranilate isomerase